MRRRESAIKKMFRLKAEQNREKIEKASNRLAKGKATQQDMEFLKKAIGLEMGTGVKTGTEIERSDAESED